MSPFGGKRPLENPSRLRFARRSRERRRARYRGISQCFRAWYAQEATARLSSFWFAGKSASVWYAESSAFRSRRNQDRSPSPSCRQYARTAAHARRERDLGNLDIVARGVGRCLVAQHRMRTSVGLLRKAARWASAFLLSAAHLRHANMQQHQDGADVYVGGRPDCVGPRHRSCD